MKKIFIIISKTVMRRNLLDTDFWPELQRNNPDTRFVIITEPDQVEFISKEYGAANVVVHGYERERGGFRWRLAQFLVRTCLHTHSAKRYRLMAHELKEATLVATAVKSFIWHILAPHAWYQRGVRKMLLRWMRSLEVATLFNTERPDLLFAPSMIDNHFDIPFAAEAKRRGVRTVGMVRSWDNLTSHSLLGVIPDRMLYQNKWLQRMGQSNLQRITAKSYGAQDLVGLPHYDLYKEPGQYLIPREEFIRAKGLQKDKKIIFVAGSQLYRSGYILPSVFEEMINSGKISSSVQVLFRPHPKHVFSMDDYKLSGMEHIVLDEDSQKDIKFSDTQNFINSLYHADVIIGVSSTITIDAAVFNKPVVDVGFDDANKKVGKWASVERLYDTEDHYERILEISDTPVAISEAELAQHVNSYLRHPTAGEEGRRQILDEFVEPFDGMSGKRLANILTEEISLLG